MASGFLLVLGHRTKSRHDAGASLDRERLTLSGRLFEPVRHLPLGVPLVKHEEVKGHSRRDKRVHDPRSDPRSSRATSLDPQAECQR